MNAAKKKACDTNDAAFIYRETRGEMVRKKETRRIRRVTAHRMKAAVCHLCACDEEHDVLVEHVVAWTVFYILTLVGLS